MTTTTHTTKPTTLHVRYVAGEYLPKTVPVGRVLMHNHVRHGRYWGCGLNGFRSWWADKPFDGFVPCPCGFADLPHYALRDHVKFQRSPKGKRVMRKLDKLGWRAGEGE
jgi:hypothetical protein